MSNSKRWPNLLSVAGGVGVVLGAFDPLEGSMLILPGSALLALGSYFSGEEVRVITYRAFAFILVALGVGALFGLSAIGGVGGTSDHSIWWTLLVLPYLAGWALDIWGPGSPRWLRLAGTIAGVWLLAVLSVLIRRF